MIWVWIKRLLVAIAKLLIPPPATLRTQIDPDAPCPVCGNVGSQLKFERMVPPDSKDPRAMVRKTCATCEFAHYEEPISAPQFPAV